MYSKVFSLILFFSTLEIFGIRIRAVGDMVSGTNFRRKAIPKNVDDLFKPALADLRNADITFGNFESTLTNYPKTRKNTNRKLVFAFRSPPSHASAFTRAGFDVLTVANNHSNDFYSRGAKDTVLNFEKAGISVTGVKNRIIYYNAKNKKIAFIGFSYLPIHNHINNTKKVRKLIKKASSKSDMVVVTMHAGGEGSKALHTKNKTEYFHGENRGNLVQFSHNAIDSGADLVLGHGPHVPRALELYKGRLIAYSLGNFIGYRVFSLSSHKGTSLILDVKLNNDGSFQSGKILPYKLHSPGIPHPDPNKTAIRLIRRLTRQDFPRTRLKVSPDGKIKPK